MHEVINISDRLFPVGSTAWHVRYHFCYVVEANHFRRTILYERDVEDYQMAEVSVHDLAAINCRSLSKK